ncbi:MAG: 4Fe-4S dicluster domain-containing protein [Ignavibacteria bacterium]|nr:4Fe-4S dicluster domain-containing protein [Ignavibacteria bacterium]
MSRTEETRYWRSLRDLADHPEVAQLKSNEFLAGVTDESDVADLSPVSRRTFLALLSASAAFAAASCTNYRDKGEVVPYNKQPEEITIGKANYYASTCTGCSANCGILIKTREGRPVKVDGNPDHPVNAGKLCVRGQASVLDLYDPQRLRTPQFKGSGGGFAEGSWEEADRTIMSQLAKTAAEGKEIALVTHTVTSPTFRKVLDAFMARYPSSRTYSYELFSDRFRSNAWIRSYGSNGAPVIRWEAARTLLLLEADVLATEGDVLEQIRSITKNRDMNDPRHFSRIWVAEAGLSLTGMNADHRIRLKPGAQFEFVMGLIHEVAQRRKLSAISPETSVVEAIGQYPLAQVVARHRLPAHLVEGLVNGLVSHRGESIVFAGSTLPEEVHTAVILLNEVLGNTGLYDQRVSRVQYSSEATMEDWVLLVQKMREGKIGAIVHVDANPAYHLPQELRYAEAAQRVPAIVTLTQRENESSVISTIVLPINHAFESWGDFKTRTGQFSLQQPVIEPLYATRQKEAILLHWASGSTTQPDASSYHRYLKKRWEEEVYPSIKSPVAFSRFWHAALHDGLLLHSEKPIARGQFIINADWLQPLWRETDQFTVLVRPSQNVGDGRYAENGWLQEIPHPVSKVVWDNYAAVAPQTAKSLGVENNDIIDIRAGERRLQIPVFVQPGTAEDAVVIEHGYGRRTAGPVGTDVGFDVGSLMPVEIRSTPYIFSAAVTKGSGSYELVSTQEHHALDDAFVKDLHLKRKIIREGSVAQYLNTPDFIQKGRHEPESITKILEYDGVKWAMAIDLNKCIGCTACVASCVAENNIPVVGKEQVELGREMQWIRIDRYYSGTPEDPVVSNQPMLCQHCDHAPCENVCPVAATNHSPDGLNQMAYNRCVGTRYCSNNCPYKVRRFNFLDFRNDFADGIYAEEPMSALYNPEVTVRSRGVMEKCTFCIQRIMEARQVAAEEGREIRGSDVVTACQQACPADAIVFGDMNDPQSKVSHYRAHNLGYHVLEEINVRPNVTYMAKLRNRQTENPA